MHHNFLPDKTASISHAANQILQKNGTDMLPKLSSFILITACPDSSATLSKYDSDRLNTCKIKNNVSYSHQNLIPVTIITHGSITNFPVNSLRSTRHEWQVLSAISLNLVTFYNSFEAYTFILTI